MTPSSRRQEHDNFTRFPAPYCAKLMPTIVVGFQGWRFFWVESRKLYTWSLLQGQDSRQQVLDRQPAKALETIMTTVEKIKEIELEMVTKPSSIF
jgi:hypothetical protein